MGNSITVNGVAKDAIHRQKTMTNTTPSFHMNYTITMLFKDGKIRINNPTVNKMYTSGNNREELDIVGASALGIVTGVFNSKGKVLAEKSKESIENFFIVYVNDIQQSVAKNESTDW